ncbi:MAG: response regulator [Rhodospirillaceae bacterium]|jgi:CheY-like chemotaxis protein|nr:response regulator [Rhodospirillaceae bacterium]MBT5243370.1 response regulator [Rhodospirillaceae bacterium]MBT5561275.1 response regulator [Rhodospirillaceae bacterium]MBT6243350.1 response regulator [Rhodospirillaceae bacterium]MBT7139030.1 response regulator [Rhodospirillaceae bacterium]
MTIKNANKILIVDDDTVIMDFMTELLQDEISVSYTSEGAKALELGKLHKPDLILLDVMMPGMDGFEVCALLKADPETQHIPVVFLTGKADEKDIARGLELGAIDYITKPFDPELITIKINNILKQITATRAATKPAGGGNFKADKAADRRADGERRPDRIPKVAPDGAQERRAHGPTRPDRFPKPDETSPSGMSLKQFLLIAVLVAVAGGGGYAWYSNTPAGSDSVSKTGPATPAPTNKQPMTQKGLTEDDMQAVIAEAYDQSGNSSQTTSSASTRACGELPKVPWWGNVSHESIISYVNNKNSGDWDAYVAKWERQLEKLGSIQSRGGTVIAPKLGTRLTGTVLAEYVDQVETRLKVTRCLAKVSSPQ